MQSVVYSEVGEPNKRMVLTITSATDIPNSIVVETLPAFPSVGPNKRCQMYINPQDGYMWFEIEEVAQTNIQTMQKQIDDLTLLVGDLMLGVGA